MSLTTSILNNLPIDPLTGSISTPIYQTSTFVQEAPGIHKGFDYARSNNPTRQVLENLIAKLEYGKRGFAFASGLAAIDAVLKLLQQGDEILAVKDIYGGAYRLFTHVYQKFGINVKYIDTCDAEQVLHNISKRTKLIWIESPTNPTLKISDIERIAQIAKTHDVLLCVDNTFASPAAQQPLKLGADIVVHSGTKYLGGHSDLIAGLVITQTDELGDKIKFIQNASGAILGPFDSWLLIRGIETLELRIQQHSKSALQIAQYLQEQELINQVYYPGLPNHPNHAVATKQLKHFGGIISFDLQNDDADLAHKIVCNTRYFKLAESLGGAKSLICLPSAMTHKSIPEETRKEAGLSNSLIRLSVGLENTEDLIADLTSVLSSIKQLELC